MSNCVYPTTLRVALQNENDRDFVTKRFLGLQANASSLTPERLSTASNLHTDGIDQFISDFEFLCSEFPLKIVGGCCGTDHIYLDRLSESMVNLKKQKSPSSRL